MDKTNAIGTNIKRSRSEKGITQKELAAALGVSYQMVQSWERGARNPKMETIQKIAAALGVSWLDLMPKEALNANTIEDFAKDNGELAQELVQQLPKETERLMQQLHDAAIIPRHGEITDSDIQKVSDIMQTRGGAWPLSACKSWRRYRHTSSNQTPTKSKRAPPAATGNALVCAF